MSLRSEHIEGAFTPGYWTVEVRLRSEAAGPRYLCHAANDREARRIAAGLAAAVAGSRGFSYDRLATPPPAALPPLGEAVEIRDAATWAHMLEHALGDRRLNRRAQ